MNSSKPQINKNTIQPNERITFTIKGKTIQTTPLLPKQNIYFCGNTNCGAVLTTPGKCNICNSLHNIQDILKLQNGVAQVVLNDNINKTEQSPCTVFCIDCSGTMEGARLDCMRSILMKYIEETSFTSPNERICIVVFGTDVFIYGDGTSDVMKIQSYLSKDDLVKKVEGYAEIKSLHESREQLKKVVNNLQFNGLTCGVSALLASTIIAARYGGKIIYCTDGSSNRGVSAQIGVPAIIELAKPKGISIDMFSFSDCSSFLEPYRDIYVKTNGRIDVLKTGDDEIETNQEVMAPTLKKVLFGINVTKKLYSPSFITTEKKVIEEQNLTDQREHIVNYTITDVNQMKKNDKITVQMTLEYLNSDGKKVLFVCEKSIPLTLVVEESDIQISIKGFLTLMKKYIIEQPNFNEGLKIVSEYKQYRYEVDQDTVSLLMSVFDQYENMLKDLKSGRKTVDDDMTAFIDRMVSDNEELLTTN